MRCMTLGVSNFLMTSLMAKVKMDSSSWMMSLMSAN